MLPVAVVISGRGSNMQAIHRSIKSGKLDAEVVTILSDQAEAPGLAYAQAEGLLTRVILKEKTEAREAYDQRLIDAIAPVRSLRDLLVFGAITDGLRSQQPCGWRYACL